MVPLLEIFCVIDDFCKYFEKELYKNALSDQTNHKSRNRSHLMSMSEMMTIVILFHLSHYKTFKDFYRHDICGHYTKDFPKRLSYSRFIQLMPTLFMPLVVFLNGLKGKQTGKYYIDSTKLPACHNLRIYRHKVFKDIAARGKTSTGWFFGFKLHLIINDQAELMQFSLTPGNVDDRNKQVIDKLTEQLQGWLFGDRGYIGKRINHELKDKGLELITRVKSNMKEKIISPIKNYYLNKRNMIETVIDQLKHALTIAHSRHRSSINMQVNVLSGLVAYIFKPKKSGVSFYQHLLQVFNLPTTPNPQLLIQN